MMVSRKRLPDSETNANLHDPPTDWDMPHEHIKYAIDVWKGHFWDHLVGFYHQGRNHVR